MASYGLFSPFKRIWRNWGLGIKLVMAIQLKDICCVQLPYYINYINTIHQ